MKRFLVVCLNLLLALGSVQGQEAAFQPARYLDPTAPVDERVADLLARMTLEEKVGQMTQINLLRLLGDAEWARGPLNPQWLRIVFEENHVGSILSGGGASPVPNTPRTWAETTNELQRYAIETSRLGIPILYGIDAVHGHSNVVGATIFPHNIGLAATWNPDLVEKVAASTREAVRATGIHWNFGPVVDLGFDPRWGRFYETFGEDPQLISEMVAASVRGFQGDDLATGVAATVKHFIGYGQTLTGRDRSAAMIPMRMLRDLHFPPAEAGLAAGARTVMANSGSVNGVPVHVSHTLLTEVLRDELGFTGPVVSDWEDIDKLVTAHRVAADFREAVRRSILAGIDMVMVPHDAPRFTETLIALVEAGELPEARIDEAVGRILALKFELGLFENPYVDADMAGARVINVGRDLARQAATETLTLLKNQGNVLPFGEGVQTVLVTGPSADDVAAQMGGWTIGWQGVESDADLPPAVTVLEGLEAAAPEGVTVHHVPRLRNGGFREVSEAALEADVAVVVVGEGPYAEGLGDVDELSLAPDQDDLIRDIAATGTPVVVVMMSGRPLIMSEAALEGASAFLMAYLPGTEAGSAIADVLFGEHPPSGRLPFTWPRGEGQLPLTHNRYRAEAGPLREPLFPFGYGLGYTEFSLGRPEVSASVAPDGTLQVSLEVSNTGERAGTETVMVFAWPEYPSVVTPVRRLVAFTRVALEPGASERVAFEIPLERLAIIPGDIEGTAERVVESGRYVVGIGAYEVPFNVD